MSGIVLFHVIAGIVALAVFPIPLFTRKGGKAHARAGWIYAGAMYAVAFSAFVITPYRFFLDPARTEKSRFAALFLFFIALFALTSLQQGVYVLTRKRKGEALFTLKTLGLPVALLAVSVGIIAVGAIYGKALFLVFGTIAGRVAYKEISYWRNTTGWLVFHLENMFVCCIATVTAFAVTAVPRLFPQLDTLVVWISPTVVMVPWMLWFIRRFSRSSSRPIAAQPA